MLLHSGLSQRASKHRCPLGGRGLGAEQAEGTLISPSPFPSQVIKRCEGGVLGEPAAAALLASAARLQGTLGETVRFALEPSDAG